MNAAEMVAVCFRRQNADLFDTNKETILAPNITYQQTDETYHGFNEEGMLSEGEIGNGQTLNWEGSMY